MVSRRNFFTVTVIMAVLLFLFQSPEVIKDRVNTYSTNRYEEKTKTAYTSDSVYRATEEDVRRTGRYAVYIGDCEDQATGAMVQQWSLYTKRYLKICESLDEFEFDSENLPEVLLLDSSHLNLKQDGKRLLSMAEQGMNLIFCNLPDVSAVAESEELMELLGIRYIRDREVTVAGMHLFSGLLLGGEKYYLAHNKEEEKQQDLELTMPWYHVSSGTKAYMVGLLDEEEKKELGIKNEELPAVIWRNSVGSAKVFAVNGPYLADNSGIGILDGMLTEMREYEIYPVINAQNLVLVNYPGLTEENTQELMKRYSQSMKAVGRDIVWPGIATVMERKHMGLTALLSPRLDYTDRGQPDAELLVYYMKLLQEQYAEAGLSGDWKASPGAVEKLRLDEEFLSDVIPDYPLLSLYQGKITERELREAFAQKLLKNVRTVYKDYEKGGMLVDYSGEAVTCQSAVNDGYSHTFSEDIRMNGIESALAYTSVSTDLGRVFYPENEEDSWEKLFDHLSSNLDTYWKAYEDFEGTTLSESDKRIREFLALNYTQKRSGDTITLQTDNLDEQAWFILRTHGEEITEANGAVYDKIEEGAYLVKVTEKEVTIRLESSDERYYYE